MDHQQSALELGSKPVGQLLMQYAMPAIVAMSASSLYNIIDRAMIGQMVGPEAIAGLGITFPFMNLSGAFGAAVGVGAANLREPYAARDIIAGLPAVMAKYGIENLTDIIGGAHG